MSAPKLSTCAPPITTTTAAAAADDCKVVIVSYSVIAFDRPVKKELTELSQRIDVNPKL